MTELIEKLKTQIIGQLNLQDVTPEGLDPDEPLFGGRLGLDSIDALEFMVLLEKEYGLRVKDHGEGKKILRSVRTMAEYITAHGKG